MPLFDINSALSCELNAAHQLAARLSETTAVQQLAEAENAAEALAKIVVGIDTDPVDGESYNLDELNDRHFLAHVYAEPEAGHAAAQSPEAVGVPDEGGVFRVYLCRQIRDSEDPVDAYNFVWDLVSAIGTAVISASETTLTAPRNYRFTRVDRLLGPQQTTRRGEGNMGKRLEALLRVAWGDAE